MWLLALINPAHATELAFQLQTGEGIEERWTKDYKEAWTRQFGPVAGRGKRRVRYDVTVMPSVYDPVADVFETQVSVCRYWQKGGDRDRDCVEDLLLVPPQDQGPVVIGGKVKGSDKFELTFAGYYSGPPPTAAGLPGQEPEPEPEPEPEVVVEVPEEPPEPEKDEMTSALESIASEVVEGLGAGTDDDEDTSDDE